MASKKTITLVAAGQDGWAPIGKASVFTDLNARKTLGAENDAYPAGDKVGKVKAGPSQDYYAAAVVKYVDEANGDQHTTVWYRFDKGWALAQDTNEAKGKTQFYAQNDPEGAEKWAKIKPKDPSKKPEQPPFDEPPSDPPSSAATPVIMGLGAAALVYFVALRK